MTGPRWLILVALVVVAGAVAWGVRPVAHTDAERVDHIAAELRCPVCQGLSVQDSPSETARAMKDVVAARVAAGRTDEQIRAEFQQSYGDWILLAPPLFAFSGLVWVAPLAAVAAGALFALDRTRARPPTAPEPLEADLRRLRELVDRDEGSA